MPEENYQSSANNPNEKQPAAEQAPSAGDSQASEASQAGQKRKLFCIYDFAGGDEGGVSPKGLGIFILCATAVIAAFFIIASLQ